MKVTATLEGWFLFCPIYLVEHDEYGVIPIPKYNLDWLLDAALFVQQGFNYIHALLSEEGGGFWFSVHECQPREFTIPWGGEQ